MNTKQKQILKGVSIFYFVFFLPIFAIRFVLDGDLYWIIKTGEYLCSAGFPKTDFLSMHTEMELVIQQWLSDVIFYKAYNILGVLGPILIVYCTFIVFSLLFYKLTSLVSNSTIFTIGFVFIGNAYIAKNYMVTRPQIFTYCIILIELIMLEKYVATGKIKYLFVLPFLSVLIVNLHASMWSMLFIIMIMYIISALPVKIKGKSIACCKIVPLICICLLTAVCGLISPYGYKGLAFIFTASVGNKVNSTISELAPLTLSFNAFDLLQFFIIALIIAVYILNRRGKTQLRYVLLTIATGAMALMYIKLVPYFIITAYPAAAHYMNNIKIDTEKLNKMLSKKNNASNARQRTKKQKIFIISLLIICIVLIFSLLSFSVISTAVEYVKTNGESEYTQQLDEALLAIEKDSKSTNTPIVLFNDFNSGGYIEFKGYKAYIDPRADSFVKEANNDFDYLSEYYDVKSGKIYYKDFADKYKFTYYLIENSINPLMKTTLSNDGDYTAIYSSDKFTVFKAENKS